MSEDSERIKQKIADLKIKTETTIDVIVDAAKKHATKEIGPFSGNEIVFYSDDLKQEILNVAYFLFKKILDELDESEEIKIKFYSAFITLLAFKQGHFGGFNPIGKAHKYNGKSPSRIFNNIIFTFDDILEQWDAAR